MAVPGTPFQLRPRRLGELLDLTFRVYRRRFALFAFCGALMTLVMAVVGLTVQLVAFSSLTLDAAGVPDVAALMVMFASVPLLVLVRGVVLGCTSMIFIGAVHDTLLGRRTPARELVRGALPRMPTAALTALLWSLLLMVGILMCLLPGIVFAIVFGLVIPAVYLERRGCFAAFARSWELVVRRGPGGIGAEVNWVRALVIGFVTLVVLWALYGLASMPILVGQSIAQLSGMVPRSTPLGPQVLPLTVLIPLQLFGSALQGVFFPIGVIPWPLLFYDIRIRHEGLDLEYRLEGLRERAAPAGAP